MSALYKDPILQKLIERLNAVGPSALQNKYFVGDPIVLPAKSVLPVCFVSRDTTNIAIDTNIEDRHEMPVVLNVVYNATAEINQGEWSRSGTLALYDLCEGRDDTYTLRSNSLAGAIRSNQVLDAANKLYIDINGQDTVIEYVVSPPTRRGIYSMEAIVRLRLVQYQVRQ